MIIIFAKLFSKLLLINCFDTRQINDFLDMKTSMLLNIESGNGLFRDVQAITWMLNNVPLSLMGLFNSYLI